MNTATALNPPGIAPGSWFRHFNRGNLVSLMMVAPLLLFVLCMVVTPTILMLLRAVEDPVVSHGLPATVSALNKWDGKSVPRNEVYSSMAEDLIKARDKGELGSIAGRLNQDYPGARSLFSMTSRDLSASNEVGKSWHERFASIDERWEDRALWTAIRNAGSPFTVNYLLQAIDLKKDSDGRIVERDPAESIHVALFAKTFGVALLIAVVASVLAFPVAYVLSQLSVRKANLIMILVLLPFWTSLLVRVTSWIVLLQDQGVINNILVSLGILDDADRLHLIFNLPAVILVGVYVAIPFAVLPTYSVMRSLPANLMRAGVSLGASRMYAFRRIFVPLCLPGLGAGASLVFILVLGYYLTPALVGGRQGTLISNVIAFHMQESLNWSLAAAVSTVLLLVALPIYVLNHRLTSRR